MDGNTNITFTSNVRQCPKVWADFKTGTRGAEFDFWVPWHWLLLLTAWTSS
jgi:hypothetical protein